MNIVAFFLAGLLSFPGGPEIDPKKAKEGEPGRERYYQYEREDVSRYRDRVNFQRPEPEIDRPAPVQTLPQPVSLAPYFSEGNAYHIESNPQLQTLIQTHKEINENIRQVEGYRIQIYSGTNRSRAYGIKSQLLGLGFTHKPYLEFTAPNFTVRLGDFLDKEEATLFFRREIEGRYRGAVVVPERVNVPKYNDLIELEERRERLEKDMELEDPYDPEKED